MKFYKYLAMAVLLVAMFPFNLFSKDLTYQELWNKVEKAQNEGLPQTAIKEIEPIIEKSLKENEYAWALKSICAKVVLEGEVQGNLPEEKIKRFEKTIEKSDSKIQPMLKVILAKWYFNYYQRNRYRFIRRSKTEGLDSEDFKTWDLPKLFSHISNIYDTVLENEEDLSKIPISKFDDFLVEGNQPAELRSNLFEFLVHDALNFYSHEDQSTAKPQNAFEIEANSKVFSNVDEFINWVPETDDKTSAAYKSLKLYQKLLSLNLATNNINALIVNDLLRLKWAKRVSVGPEKSERYCNALYSIIEKNAKSEYSANAMYELAVEYRQQNNNLKALEFAETASTKWPESYGGTLSQNLISEIKYPSIYLESEKVINPKFNKLKISYKNLNHVYFRIIKRTEDKVLKSSYGVDSFDRNVAETILNEVPAYTFDTELEPDKEYKTVSKEINLPTLEKGYYWIISSVNDSFSYNNENSISIGSLIVSDLAIIARERTKNGKAEVFILNAETGSPVANAVCKLYEHKYNKGYKLIETEKSDKEGKVKFSVENSNYLLICNNQTDSIYSEFNFYTNYERDYNTNKEIYFFTDRAIYRPGQTVYFKAIVVKNNQDKNIYEVVPNYNLTVCLNDPNYQLVKSLDLTTNEFGSCTGTFIAPTDRLTGSYNLTCNKIDVSTSIRIEEYKRPKFQVTIDTPEEEYQVGQTIKIKGTAKSYTGASIDNATVKFRVERKARFPYWCWWRRISNNSQEIKHGTIKTDSNGNFTIAFDAIPDKTLAKEDDPIFTFEISADVTDNTGETRSNTTSVNVAYTGLTLSIGSAKNFDCNKPFELAIFSRTHNYKNVTTSGRYQIVELKQPEKPARHAIGVSEITDTNSALHAMAEGKVIAEDNFTTNESGNYNKKLSLAEGIYKIKVTSQDKYGAEVKAEQIITAINYDADKMTVKLPFFFESITEKLQPGDTFKGFWATGYDEGPAYIEYVHRNKVIKSFWTDSKKNKQFITHPITEDLRGGFTIKIFQVKENVLYETSSVISVPWSNKNLNVKLAHFTSKMEPGTKESWKLEVSGENAEMNTIEMLASMYDASLDAYANAYWPKIGHFYSDYENISNSYSNKKANISTYKNTFTRIRKNRSIIYPSFPHNIITDYYYGSRYYMCDEAAPMMLSRSVSKGLAGAPVRPMLNSSRASLDCVSNDVAEEACEMEDNAAAAMKSEGSESNESTDSIDLSKVSARTNLNETAFFLPQLTVNNDGVVTIDFEMPEALTTWKFRAYAHGKKLQEGQCTQEVITQKELMIQPNAPRFLRENDKLEFSVKVTNLSDKEQSGQVSLNFLDAITEESRDEEFKNTETKKSFKIPAGESKGITWLIQVPLTPGFVKYKAVGATTTNSDGEEGLLPILSSRILVTESLPLPIRGPKTQEYKFQKLIESSNSNTLAHKGLTVEVTSNPAWYAIQALPYLIEFPHECSEQTFNRLYANQLAQHIANSNPKIRNIFNIWLKDEQYNQGTALKSNLEKNTHLKSVALLETPWVLDAKSETEQKHKIGVLFEEARLSSELEKASNKLKEMQFDNGAFPWFPGGHENTFITSYIMTGFGRLRHLGTNIDLTIALKAVDFMDSEVKRWYEEILKIEDYKNKSHMNSFIAFYLYGRSFFLKDKKIPTSAQIPFNFFVDQAKKHWQDVSRMGQAHIALALQRIGDKQTPEKIVKSIIERSVTDEELGRFWRENEISFSWNRAEIETQAMMIELFSEVSNNEELVEECKVWILKQKQTQSWKTTKSTADAIYSLILRGTDLLSSNKLVKIKLANEEVKPEKVEAGTGYYQKIYSPSSIKSEMGNIELIKEDKGVAWGALHWQYLEDMSKVTPHENNLKLKKTLFIKENTEKGQVIKPVTDGKLTVGDEVVIRIELRTDRDLEFVHMKDQRGSGMEPVNVLSRYKWQDGLGYYEATKDAASHFYIDYLPKGTYVFEYNVRIQLAGEYQTGIAEIQCMYAPEFNSHSESFMLHVSQQ